MLGMYVIICFCLNTDYLVINLTLMPHLYMYLKSYT